MYNRLVRIPELKLLPLCQKLDLGVLARVPLASGALSGKYRPGMQFPSNDLRSTRDQDALQQDLQEAEKIKETEVPAGLDMATWALGWCLKHPAVTCVLSPAAKAQSMSSRTPRRQISLK